MPDHQDPHHPSDLHDDRQESNGLPPAPSPPPEFAARAVVLMAIIVEGGLALIGWAAAAWQGIDLAGPLRPSGLAFAAGLLTALPFIALAIGSHNLDWAPMRRIRHDLDRILPVFKKLALWQIALISILAGVGEEILFRGVLQQVLLDRFGLLAGLLGASLLFGMVHYLSFAYFISATLMGFILGGLYLLTDSLLAAVIAHAVYDFGVLIFLTRAKSD